MSRLFLLICLLATTVSCDDDTCISLPHTALTGGALSSLPVAHTADCCILCFAIANCTAAGLEIVLVPQELRCTCYANYTISNVSSSTATALMRASTAAPTPAPSADENPTFFIVLYGVLGAGILMLAAAILHVYRERVCCCDRTPPGWRYAILSELGVGAFSSVFLVRRLTDGEKLALKLIPCRNKQELNEAINEYRTTLRLQGHDNLVRVHDMFTNWNDTVSFSEKRNSQTTKLLGGKKRSEAGEPKYLCIVMVYYPEGTLLDLLTKITVPLPELTIVGYTMNIASALAHMHQHHVMHRDLKPANILMDREYTITVVTDFGLCRSHNGEYCHTRAGTLHYMAPEQADRKYTSMADMWALGCLIYGMATRRVRQPRVRVMFMARRSPTFDDELREEMKGFNYSDGLINFMLRLLVVKPSERPTAVQAFEQLRDMAGILREVR